MNAKILEELEMIRKQGKGILYPEAVVDFASSEDTALHSRFEWDDAKASQEYRIWQARQLIKIVVLVEKSSDTEISAYVSLSDDRAGDGGYRSAIEVLSNEQLRRQMIEGAIKDFEYWQFRYKQLVELESVFMTMDKIKTKYMFKKK